MQEAQEVRRNGLGAPSFPGLRKYLAHGSPGGYLQPGCSATPIHPLFLGAPFFRAEKKRL